MISQASEAINYTVFLFTGVALFSLLAGFIIYFIFMYRNRQKRFELEKKEMLLRYQQVLLSVEMEIRDQTLSHVARELHDHIGQMALLIKLHLSSLTAEKPSSVEKLNEARSLSADLIRDIKQLSKGLKNYDVLKDGLAQAIQAETARMQRAGATFTIHINTLEDTTLHHNKEKESFLFRMFQEIMNNIVQHAEASEVCIDVGERDKQFILCITDNGKGMEQVRGKGSGLDNLYERSKLIGASIDISSSVGGGTCICIKLPLL